MRRVHSFNKIICFLKPGERAGHALLVFEHSGDLWAYDSEKGSFRIGKLTASVVASPRTVLQAAYGSRRFDQAEWW